MVNHDEACTAAALDDEAAAFPPGHQLSTLTPNIRRGCRRCASSCHGRTHTLSHDSPHSFPNACCSSRMLKKSLFLPARPQRAETRLFPCGVLASLRG